MPTATSPAHGSAEAGHSQTKAGAAKPRAPCLGEETGDGIASSLLRLKLLCEKSIRRGLHDPSVIAKENDLFLKRGKVLHLKLNPCIPPPKTFTVA